MGPTPNAPHLHFWGWKSVIPKTPCPGWLKWGMTGNTKSVFRGNWTFPQESSTRVAESRCLFFEFEPEVNNNRIGISKLRNTGVPFCNLTPKRTRFIHALPCFQLSRVAVREQGAESVTNFRIFSLWPARVVCPFVILRSEDTIYPEPPVPYPGTFLKIRVSFCPEKDWWTYWLTNWDF